MTLLAKYNNGNLHPISDAVGDTYARKGRAELMLERPPSDMTKAAEPKLTPVERSETAKITTRIEELESTAEKQRQAVERAQRKVADVIASGGDDSAARQALTAAKDDLAGTVDALKMLDAKLVTVSQQEQQAALEALRIRTANRYVELVAESKKAVDQMTDRINKILGEHAEGLPERLVEVIRETCWSAANEGFTKDYLRYVPRRVKHAPKRNADGTIHVEPVHAIV